MNKYNSDTIRLIQITDSHLYKNPEEQLLGVNTKLSFDGVINHALNNKKHLDMVIATGDISHDGSICSYKYFLESVQKLSSTVRGLPGNHDIPSRLKQQWNRCAEPITDLNNWIIVSLDSTIEGSNDGYLQNNQLALLEHACSMHPDKHILVAVHHNPVPVGSKWLDNMMISNGHELFALINTHKNIRAVIWGHVHQEFDSVYSFGPSHKVRLLACPATSIQFMPRSKEFSLDIVQPGYRVIDLKPTGEIQTKVVRVSGLNLTPDHKSTGY